MLGGVEAAASHDRRVWDGVADRYDDAVLDNLAVDLGCVLLARLTEACDRAHGRAGVGDVTAVDFGCGTGKWLPALAARCDRVIGIDYSPELLAVAHGACLATATPRVQLLQRDLSEPWPLVLGSEGGTTLSPPADVAVCANVVMSPDPATRHRMLANIRHSLHPAGTLLLLVPAAESVEVVRQRQGEW